MVVTIDFISFIKMSTGRCNMQTADYRQTMDCRLGTRGKMQCYRYFHYQELTINRRNKPLLKLMRVKFSILGSLNCNTITLNIMQVSINNTLVGLLTVDVQ